MFRGSPQPFVPGFSHGSKIAMKRRKRKKDYETRMEQDVHDVLSNNHWGKRQRILAETKSFEKSKPEVEDFLANVHSGSKRSVQQMWGKSETGYEEEQPTKRKKSEPEQKEQEKAEIVPDYEVQIKKDEPEQKIPDSPSPEEATPVRTGISRMYQEAEAITPQTSADPEALERFRELAGYEATPEQKTEAPQELAPTEPEVESIPDVRESEGVEAMLDYQRTHPVQIPEAPPIPGPPPIGPQTMRDVRESEGVEAMLDYQRTHPLQIPGPPPTIPEKSDEPMAVGMEEDEPIRAQPQEKVDEPMAARMEEDVPEFKEPEVLMEEDVPEMKTPAVARRFSTPISTGIPDPVFQSTGVPDPTPQVRRTAVTPQKLDFEFEEKIRPFKDPKTPEHALKRKKSQLKQKRKAAQDVLAAKRQFERAPVGILPEFREADPGLQTKHFPKIKPKKIEFDVVPDKPTKSRVKFKKKYVKPALKTREERRSRAKLFGSDVQTIAKPVVQKPIPVARQRQTSDLLSRGMKALALQRRKVGFKDPIAAAHPQPPRRPPVQKPPGIQFIKKPPKKPEPVKEVEDAPMLQRGESKSSFPVKQRPRLQARETKSSAPVVKKKRRKLERRETSSSAPVIKKEEPKPERKTVQKEVVRERVIRERSGRGSAPSQQVSVNPTLQSSTQNLGGLASKIDELLKLIRESRTKKKQKSGLTQVKKQYSDYRKKAIKNLKDQNKEIKKRESARIKKLPTKQRSAARKKLTEVLKERETKLKKQLPSKITSPEQLKSVMQTFRTLKV